MGRSLRILVCAVVGSFSLMEPTSAQVRTPQQELALVRAEALVEVAKLDANEAYQQEVNGEFSAALRWHQKLIDDCMSALNEAVGGPVPPIAQLLLGGAYAGHARMTLQLHLAGYYPSEYADDLSRAEGALTEAANGYRALGLPVGDIYGQLAVVRAMRDNFSGARQALQEAQRAGATGNVQEALRALTSATPPANAAAPSTAGAVDMRKVAFVVGVGAAMTGALFPSTRTLAVSTLALATAAMKAFGSASAH